MGLRGFGGKMIMAHAAGMAAGDILGDQHGGRELGAVAGAMMFGGPEITAAVAGLELVGSAFRGAAEDAKIFAKAIEESNAQVLEAVRAERDRARSLIPTTKAGEQYRAEEKSLQAEIDKVQAQMAMVRASGGFGSSVAQIGEETINFFGAGMVTQEDAKRQAIGSATKEQAFLQKKLNEAREKASKEESIAWASEMTKNDRARQILERPERERDLRIGQMAEDVRPQQWTADQIAARVDSEMALQNSRFALQQTAELHPEREFNALKMKLDRAAAQGSLSDADEVYLLKKNARDLLHGTMGGEFTSATGHWESVQSQIIQKADLPQQTLEEIRQVRKQLELLNRGVKIAA
jgi:hypothetical protein